jgi:hypothetical protein
VGDEVLNCGLWNWGIWARRGKMEKIREHATHVPMMYACYFRQVITKSRVYYSLKGRVFLILCVA